MGIDYDLYLASNFTAHCVEGFERGRQISRNLMNSSFAHRTGGSGIAMAHSLAAQHQVEFRKQNPDDSGAKDAYALGIRLSIENTFKNQGSGASA